MANPVEGKCVTASEIPTSRAACVMQISQGNQQQQCSAETASCSVECTALNNTTQLS
jgi:hypothetical protein